ncbi:MAG TPA: pyruvate kinase [Acidimicrobiales bacterium]|nr:pyruvate kinase [Acidimicrobiales bacterium]
MPRRTKIVATIGPASSSTEVLTAMIDAGMDVARVSLAHGPLEDALDLVERIRAAALAAGKPLAVMADLPGPKVRAAPFPAGGVPLVTGDVLEIVVADADDGSTEDRIAVDHPTLLDEVAPGDLVSLGDGAIRLQVTNLLANHVEAEVITGGWIQGRPGVGLPPGRSTASSPTEHDLSLLAALVDAGIDAVAISFVRFAGDIERARLAAGPNGPMIIAKIETQEAIDSLEAIIAVSDGVMVARGDLGIRCAFEDVPHYQKRTIRTGVAYARPVITATQMLESMIRSPVPTRAEVSDVANAVFDGSSALMLSGETAIGSDPVNVVATMGRIAERAEREFDYELWGRNLGRQQMAGAAGAPAAERITAAISAASWRAAIDADVAAIIACTDSGATARAISRFRPRMPIFGATPSERTARQLSMAWGITPLLTERHGTTDDVVWFAIKAVSELGAVKPGDIVAVLVGSPADPEPATDTLRLVRVH